ncbi:hypothetical protein ACFWXH_06020 [Mesorhizobium sp. NPDC059054]|uniref:hypothetical protein n=1 Tax=unclassified Mesorhizobium TaxID=325217 RepID=UPI000AEAE50B|nr:hypothetical protein [Mesorhizobium sp. 1M-11]
MARSVVGLRPVLGMVLLALGGGAARADDIADRWRFGSAPDGSITASVSADSIIAIGSGALGYRPVLTIACRPDGEPQWSEWLQLNDGVAAGDTITVVVSVDGGQNFKEDWSVSNGSRTLMRPGTDAVSRLASAKHLRLSWRFGVITGRAKADFFLGGAAAAIDRLAAECKIATP